MDEITLSVIIALVIAIGVFGLHYSVKPVPVLRIVKHTTIDMKKRRSLKYRFNLSSYPLNSSLVIPTTGVQPIEYVSVTTNPSEEGRPITSTNSTGINGSNQLFIYNCSNVPIDIRGMNVGLTNTVITNPPAKVTPVVFKYGATDNHVNEYDGTYAINLGMNEEIKVISSSDVVFNRVTMIFDGTTEKSIYVYFIDTSNKYKGVRLDGIKNDILVIDFFK
jgi:hypothetical protein